MKTGTKALNTDVLKVMQNIVSSHVEHYQSDFDYDIEALKEAPGRRNGQNGFLYGFADHAEPGCCGKKMYL